MIRIWIKQVFRLVSNLFWIEENMLHNFPVASIIFKEKWIISLYPYKDKVIKDSIWQLKFRSDKEKAKYFGKELAITISSLHLNEYILIPIPIHWRRRLERGFNQTEWLCREIISHNNYMQYWKALKRPKYSKKQSWSNKKVRQENIQSVFKIKPAYVKHLHGKNFLLIDDVVTTGATLKEARHELLIHGATSVKALTIAC